jgi:hypothetical protein
VGIEACATSTRRRNAGVGVAPKMKSRPDTGREHNSDGRRAFIRAQKRSLKAECRELAFASNVSFWPILL